MKTIYCLVDTLDGIPRYVGKTKNPESRLRGHRDPPWYGNPMHMGWKKPDVWRHRVDALGGEIRMVPLDECKASVEDLREVEWTVRLEEMGFPLVNAKYGPRAGGKLREPQLIPEEMEIWKQFREDVNRCTMEEMRRVFAARSG